MPIRGSLDVEGPLKDMDFDFAFRRRIRLRTKISFALKLYRYGFIPTTHAAFGLNRRRVAHGPSFSATALETVSWVSIAYNFYARPRRGRSVFPHAPLASLNPELKRPDRYCRPRYRLVAFFRIALSSNSSSGFCLRILACSFSNSARIIRMIETAKPLPPMGHQSEAV